MSAVLQSCACFCFITARLFDKIKGEKMDSSLQNQEEQAEARQATTLQLFLGFIICAAALLLFSLLAKNIIGNSSLVQLDQNVATALHGWAAEDFTDFFKLISLLGLQVLWGIIV